MSAVFNILCVLAAVAPLVLSQFPPQRLAIPGAVLVQQARPAPFRQQQQRIGNNQDFGPPPRLRRPNAPPGPIRPVVEEQEDTVSSTPSAFDEEVKSLGLAALQNAVRQAEEDEQPRPLQFRPERPVPVLRDDVRETPLITRPVPQFRPAPPVRQEENIPNIPVVSRQPQRTRQQAQAVQLQQRQEPLQRQQVRVNATPRPRPPPQYLDDEDNARSRVNKKPPVQILRKYRTDNADGSITWGYENEDGTFKEETLGIDCVTRGKYGYIDPDGVKRHYVYETGNKCDQPEPEEDEDELPNVKQPQIQNRNQPQLRPRPYQN